MSSCSWVFTRCLGGSDPHARRVKHSSLVVCVVVLGPVFSVAWQLNVSSGGEQGKTAFASHHSRTSMASIGAYLLVFAHFLVVGVHRPRERKKQPEISTRKIIAKDSTGASLFLGLPGVTFKYVFVQSTTTGRAAVHVRGAVFLDAFLPLPGSCVGGRAHLPDIQFQRSSTPRYMSHFTPKLDPGSRVCLLPHFLPWTGCAPFRETNLS